MDQIDPFLRGGWLLQRAARGTNDTQNKKELLLAKQFFFIYSLGRTMDCCF